MTSPASLLIDRLVAGLGPAAHTALDMALDQLSPVELAGLAYEWTDFWARPKQLAPAGKWRSWGVMSGRGFGKTRSLAQFVIAEAEAGRAGRVALCSSTDEDTRDIMVEGNGGILASSPPWFRPVYEPSLGRLTWPNGAVAFCYSAEAPEHFRGPEHHLFWGDELGSWPAATWDAAWYNMRFGLRLGYAKLVWSSTPRTVPLIRTLLARHKKHPERHRITKGGTLENRANLPAEYLEELIDSYAGTRLWQQEGEGEFLEDEAGAMFRAAWIDAHRAETVPELVRIVVAVDPAITARAGSDETGIVVIGLGLDGDLYVLEDLSGKHTPERWASIAVAAYERWGADCIVAEQNRGGNLVAQTLRTAATRREIRVKEVHARDGKRIRAQPLAAMYERGRVHHARAANLTVLETQMTSWDPGRSTSPDRIDALVHGAMELGGMMTKGNPTLDYESLSIPSRMGSGRDTEDDDGDDADDDNWR